jgi:pyruvate ferredoxin oxidoreductase gamma subunit
MRCIDLSLSDFYQEEFLEVTWLGRGGQGAVTASELIASAAIMEGKKANAIPEFGAERRGAPVRAYTRISFGWKELPKTPITKPHVVVLLDPSLLRMIPSYISPRENSILIANTKRTPQEVSELLRGMFAVDRIYTVNATRVALDILGKPIFNTPMTGAFVKIVPVVRIETLVDVIKKRFSGELGELNAQAALTTYNLIKGVEVRVHG